MLNKIHRILLAIKPYIKLGSLGIEDTRNCTNFLKKWIPGRWVRVLFLLYPPSLFLFPPKKRGKKKRRMNSKNRDFKSCLSAHMEYLNSKN